MSGGPEVALGRSADQMGLEIEGIVERGVRVWERPLWVVTPRWLSASKRMLLSSSGNQKFGTGEMRQNPPHPESETPETDSPETKRDIAGQSTPPSPAASTPNRLPSPHHRRRRPRPSSQPPHSRNSGIHAASRCFPRFRAHLPEPGDNGVGLASAGPGYRQGRAQAREEDTLPSLHPPAPLPPAGRGAHLRGGAEPVSSATFAHDHTPSCDIHAFGAHIFAFGAAVG
jgi:hypothetical protein